MVNRNGTKSLGAMISCRIIISLLIIWPAVAASDCVEQKELVQDGCYYDRSTSIAKDCSYMRQFVTWTIVDSAAGIIEPIFFTSVNCTSYSLDLYHVDDVTSADKCTASTDAQRTLHTGKEYLLEQNPSFPKCTENGKIQFKYVYTGCYALQITPKVNTNSRRPSILHRYITTDYVKETYEGHPPTVIAQYRDTDSTLVLTVVDKRLYNNPQMSLDLTHPGEAHHYIYKLVPEQSREKLVNCRSDNAACDMEYRDEIGVATCYLKDVTPGDFYLLIDLFDPVRCRSNTVWGSTSICFFESRLITTTAHMPTHATTTASVASMENQITFAVLAALFVVLLLMTVVLFRYRRELMKFMRKTPLISPRDAENGELQALSKRKVLLLYARDCEPFMNAMKALRDVLAKHGKCEVYDVHDPARDDEIAEDPESWILGRLQCEDYKTILCLSQCASLQTKESVRTSAIYRQGRFTDGLFPYAVRVLTQNLALQTYTKLFVVNWSFDGGEYKSFGFLNPYTRYGLPDNCDQLLADLLDGRVNYAMLAESLEFQLLLASYRQLDKYVTDNPTYLQDILNVEMQNREG